MTDWQKHFATSSTFGGSTEQWAYDVAKRAAPDMPEKQRQYVLSVARGEGYFGLGWGNPSARTIADSQHFGITGYEGQGSNNWGAVQGSGDAGSFPHVDYHADGSRYLGYYKRYSTPEAGFLDIARTILGGGKRKAIGAKAIKSAINAGSLKKAVYAQHANGYFELAPAKYLAAVVKNYKTMTAKTGWPPKLSVGGSTVFELIAGVLVGVGGLYGYKKLRKRA